MLLITTKDQHFTLLEHMVVSAHGQGDLATLLAEVLSGAAGVGNPDELRASGDRDPLDIQTPHGIWQELSDQNGPALALGEFVCAVVPSGIPRRGHELLDQHLKSARQTHQHRQGGVGRSGLQMGQSWARNAS